MGMERAYASYVAPTPENGNQRTTNAKGEFTAAPVGSSGIEPFKATSTQQLKAIDPEGKKEVSLGKNKLVVTSDSKGHGKIKIDNNKMNIHIKEER